MRHLLRTPIPALTIALMLCLLAVGCVLTQRDQVPQAEASEPSTPVQVEPAAPVVPRPDHVVVVVMENKHRSSLIGSPEAPFINQLAGLGANMSASYGVTHPSQPNYIALFSGSQHGITTNACRTIPGADNLGRQLLDRGLTFAGYAESMPSAGYAGCIQGNYHRKHNPWVSFDNLPKSVNRPFTAFPSNYAQLPTVAFVTPNMCNDMHNCSIRTGDDWLKKELGGYATWARSHNSLLVLTFDENAGGTVNQIPTIIVGEKVRPGTSAEQMNHYTMLRTIETAYGLPALGNAAAAHPLRTIWTTSPRAGVPVSGIANSSFELGVAGWATSGSMTSVPTARHGGSKAVRAGSSKGTKGDSIISQTIQVPSGRTRLAVAWQGRCDDQLSKAWATMLVEDTASHQKRTMLPRTCTRKGAWRKANLAVTAGHAYTVLLINHDDGKTSTPNRSYFDDVTLS